MRKLITYNLNLFLLVFTFCALNYTDCLAQSLSSTELINNAKQYDGKTVSYQGEVIGDLMRRGEFAWVNANDGKNALGIWIDKDLIKDIIYTGSFKSKGDLIEVTGVFHRACPQHGGDLDIHAVSLQKINSGRNTSEKLNLEKRNLSFILAGILGLIWILSLLKIQ